MSSELSNIIRVTLALFVTAISTQVVATRPAEAATRIEGYIVRFDNSVKVKNLINQKSAIAIQTKEVIPQLNAVVLYNSPDALMSLRGMENEILYIQANEYKKFINISPNDLISLPQSATSQASIPYSSMGNLRGVKAQEAWQKTKGQNVLVAISDTGIFWAHGDLKPNIWRNPGEMGIDAEGKDKSKNKKDDDGNGYADDVRGWDWVSNAPSALDNHTHGTHVAGTVAAIDNSTGVAGVAPRATLMAATFLNGDGSGTLLNGAKSIIYAADSGAKIINCSWGTQGLYPIIADAIAYAQSKNVLVVTAAGNDGINTDATPHSPSNENVDNVVSVGAGYDRGDITWFSNYGRTSVDLSAPGYNIRSTANFSYGLRLMYRELSGTSMAAPHVSGVAALIWSLRPDLSYRDVKRILMSSTQAVPEWVGKSATEGMVRADRAVDMTVGLSND